MKIETLPADIVTVFLPFRFAERGGRKEMLLPQDISPRQTQPDKTVVKALARAFRWRKMLESGEFATIGDLAAYEKIAPSYMTRVMRLTLLAPEIVEAVFAGRQNSSFTLAKALDSLPPMWKEQKLKD